MVKKKTTSKNQKNKGVIFLFIFIAIIMFPLGHHVSGYRAMEIAEEQVTIIINDRTVQVEALSYDLHHELYRVYLNLTQGQINQETEIHVTRDGTALIMGEIKHINEGAESNKLEEKINVELSENELSIGVAMLTRALEKLGTSPSMYHSIDVERIRKKSIEMQQINDLVLFEI